MIIYGGTLIDGGFRQHRADLRFENKIITDIGQLSHGDGFDASGMLVLPGFVDTHIHGAAGSEFASPDGSFESACLYEAQRGVTSVLPTVRCLSAEGIISAEKNILREMKRGHIGASILGINLEGPFVSPKFGGSMTSEFMQKPDVSVLDSFIAAGEGKLKIITIAPELEGAAECISRAAGAGLRVSMGHTGASYAEALSGMKAGATRVTHTFNAMAPLHHRESGILGLALNDKGITCEAICDLVHLSEPTIRLLHKLKGADRITLVSDSGVFAGMPDGVYEINGVKRIVANGECRLESGRIAGSCCTLYEGVRNLLRMGIPPAEVSKMASYTPAKAVGAEGTVGSLSPGKSADIVVLDDKFDIRAVFVRGERII